MEKMKVVNHDASGKLIPDMSKVKLWEVDPDTHRIYCQMLMAQKNDRVATQSSKGANCNEAIY